MTESRMKSSYYDEGYWEGADGSEYSNYADDPGWFGILYEAAKFLPANANVKEVGSAHGYFLKHAMEDFAFSAQGVDISEYAVKTGLSRMPFLEGRLLLGTVSDPLPWEDGVADLMFSSEFLEHVAPEEEEFVLSEMLRVLKPGGLWLHKIGIVVPDNHPFRQPTLEDHCHHNTHWNVKTREQWGETFASLGLEPVIELEAALDRRFSDRDWVMRFFAWRKPA